MEWKEKVNIDQGETGTRCPADRSSPSAQSVALLSNNDSESEVVVPEAQAVEMCSVYAESEKEAQRYKWIESEKAGHDIGFERALIDWIVKYRSAWLKHRKGDEPIANSSRLT